jgi:hypothetical protein
MRPQHHGQRIRRPARFTLGVVLGELLFQPRPGNPLAHALQEDFPAGFVLLVYKLGFGKRELAQDNILWREQMNYAAMRG